MEKKRLPIYGPGPYYAIAIATLELIGLLLHFTGVLKTGEVIDSVFKIIMLIIGGLFIILGFLIWIPAAFMPNRIDSYINDNKLCTEGVYSIVRNPCYSGITFILVGILVSVGNLWLLILPIIYYIILTIVLMQTEEKWLEEKFGLDYIKYMASVNRIIPWPRKRKEK